MTEPSETTRELSRLLEQERPRLLRFFSHQLGHPDCAEDLVQETCVEAWRMRHKLAPGAISPGWVLGIARNVVLRGRHRIARERGRRAEPPRELADTSAPLDDALEKEDLGELLGNALGLLPEAARELLAARYFDDAPIAELAGRWKLTENAATVRLHRGRQLLHRTILTHFRQAALAHGLVGDDDAPWQETRLWCANCGAHRLRGRLPEYGEGVFELRCPGCHLFPEVNFRRADTFDGTLHHALGTRGFGRIARRLDQVYHLRHQRLLRRGKAPCPGCGHRVPLVRSNPSALCPGLTARHGFHAHCTRCDRLVFGESLGRYLMGLSELQSFWRRHPRLRRPPEKDVSLEGVPAIEVVYESVTDAATRTVLCRRDDLSVLKIV